MTSSAISAQGSTFQVNTATAGAKAITAAAVGNPTIFTSAAHGLQNGDVIVFAAIVGTIAALFNGLQFIVTNKTTNTFAIDIDSTGLAYTSGGTATPQTWTTVANVKTFTGPDGAATVIDVSNLLSAAKEKRMGLPDEGNFTIEVDMDTLDAGQSAMLTARSAQTQKQFKLTLPNANTATFSGYVTKIAASGGVDAVLKRSIEMAITGAVVWA
jgi:hypothetical protein